MKMRAFFKYLFYILIIFGLIQLNGFISNEFQIDWKADFKPNISYLFIILMINLVIGVVLGFGHFLRQMRNDGRWKLNLLKLLLVGLPSLFFSLNTILIVLQVKYIGMTCFNIMTYVFHNTSDYVFIFQIVFGYILITSFYRKNEYISFNTRTLWGVYNEYWFNKGVSQHAREE